MYDSLPIWGLFGIALLYIAQVWYTRWQIKKQQKRISEQWMQIFTSSCNLFCSGLLGIELDCLRNTNSELNRLIADLFESINKFTKTVLQPEETNQKRNNNNANLCEAVFNNFLSVKTPKSDNNNSAFCRAFSKSDTQPLKKTKSANDLDFYETYNKATKEHFDKSTKEHSDKLTQEHSDEEPFDEEY